MEVPRRRCSRPPAAPATSATLPDGQTAAGLGCLPLTPDDLIDYGYCQSSPRPANIQRLAKIKASSARLRLRGPRRRAADSSPPDAWNFIHSRRLHLSLEFFLFLFFFCASFQGRLKSSTARCCFFLVKLKESEISWKHGDKELSIKRNKKKTLFSWRRYRIITPQFFFFLLLSLLLSTGVLDVASDRIWSPMHHERKKKKRQKSYLCPLTSLSVAEKWKTDFIKKTNARSGEMCTKNSGVHPDNAPLFVN